MRSRGLSNAVLLALLFSAGCEAECVDGDGQCGLTLTPRPPDVLIVWTSGMDARVGSGLAFILDTLAIADEGKGFDLDDRCRSPGDCVDNGLHGLGLLANDQIRQGLLGGETLLIVEIAGLDVPIDQDDQDITIKFYGARDADDPFFPANNFQVPQGETECCGFNVSGSSLDEAQQPTIRVPARLIRGEVTSREPVSAAIQPTVDDPPLRGDDPIALERINFSARLRSEPTGWQDPRESHFTLTDVLLGVAIPAAGFAKVANPNCGRRSAFCPNDRLDSTLLDTVAGFWQPDVDLDGEPGLERLELGGSGRIERCINERGEAALPMQASDPSSCVFSPEMGDGYSVAMIGTGVEAAIRGIEYDE